jgi:regulator of protease activity HflC (stomatin/prohibitin superfamily)
VQVGVDAVLYMQVLDPHLASYGITNYNFAIAQLAQTTLRSEIGKIELDRTFEARGIINANVVAELDKASVAWGVKVMRYEIKNITPPKDVLSAMEKQMRAEREKRAVVLTSEGERDAKINQAEGDKQRVIKASEANKQQQINEARGRRPPFSRSRPPPPRACAGRQRAERARRRRSDATAHRRGVRAPVRQNRQGEHDARRAGQPERLASVVTMATSIVRKTRCKVALCMPKRSGKCAVAVSATLRPDHWRGTWRRG